MRLHCANERTIVSLRSIGLWPLIIETFSFAPGTIGSSAVMRLYVSCQSAIVMARVSTCATVLAGMTLVALPPSTIVTETVIPRL